MKTYQVLAVVLTVACGFWRHAGSDAEALALVDKAIHAHGGVDKLRAQGQAWKVKGYLEVFGMKQNYTADYVFVAPDKIRFDMHMEQSGKTITLAVATDGKDAFEQSGTFLRDMDKSKSAEFLERAYGMHLTQLYPLKDKAYTLKALGESKLDEQTITGIKVSSPGRRDVSLYFDKTGLLVKTSTRVHDEFSQKEVTQDTLRTGYRDRNGRKVFDKMVIQRDGKTFMVEEFNDQRSLDKVDSALFAKPK
jgi:hypothetical protein